MRHACYSINSLTYRNSEVSHSSSGSPTALSRDQGDRQSIDDSAHSRVLCDTAEPIWLALIGLHARDPRALCRGDLLHKPCSSVNLLFGLITGCGSSHTSY